MSVKYAIIIAQICCLFRLLLISLECLNKITGNKRGEFLPLLSDCLMEKGKHLFPGLWTFLNTMMAVLSEMYFGIDLHRSEQKVLRRQCLQVRLAGAGWQHRSQAGGRRLAVLLLILSVLAPGITEPHWAEISHFQTITTTYQSTQGCSYSPLSTLVPRLVSSFGF